MLESAAYVLCKVGGKSGSADEIKAVLEAAGATVDEEAITKLCGDMEGKDVNELLAQGMEKVKDIPLGGGGGGGGKYFILSKEHDLVRYSTRQCNETYPTLFSCYVKLLKAAAVALVAVRFLTCFCLAFLGLMMLLVLIQITLFILFSANRRCWWCRRKGRRKGGRRRDGPWRWHGHVWRRRRWWWRLLSIITMG